MRTYAYYRYLERDINKFSLSRSLKYEKSCTLYNEDKFDQKLLPFSLKVSLLFLAAAFQSSHYFSLFERIV